MDCEICDTNGAGGHNFYCPACARAALCPHRVEHALLLLDRERLRKEVEFVVEQARERTSDASRSASDASRKIWSEKGVFEVKDSKERVAAIIRKSDNLRSSIEECKRELSVRRDELARRRKVKDISTYETRRQGVADADALRKRTRKSRLGYEKLHAEMVYSRAFLCREAAAKARLTMDKSSLSQHAFALAGLEIPDLRDLNSFPAAHITTSFTQITYLVALACDYLHIRLPAEITPPHQDWPLPTVFLPAASHQDLAVSFPRLSVSGSTSPTMTRVRHSFDPSPSSLSSKPKNRPRPLFLERTLPVLAREDPQQYLLFLEAASLLAWDVAWLCRALGLPIAETGRFEDMACVGKNLWTLLVKDTRHKIDTHRLGLQRRQSAATSKTVTNGANKEQNLTLEDLPKISLSSKPQRQGSGSVQSDKSTYGAGPAKDITASASSRGSANWAFSQPLQLRDMLKQHLLADMQGAEWEVLDDGDAVKDMMAAEERDGRKPAAGEAPRDGPVVLIGKAKRKAGQTRSGITSITETHSEVNDTHEDDILAQTAYVDDEEERRINGWTKVKSRAPP